MQAFPTEAALGQRVRILCSGREWSDDVTLAALPQSLQGLVVHAVISAAVTAYPSPVLGAFSNYVYMYVCMLCERVRGMYLCVCVSCVSGCECLCVLVSVCACCLSIVCQMPCMRSVVSLFVFVDGRLALRVLCGCLLFLSWLLCLRAPFLFSSLSLICLSFLSAAYVYFNLKPARPRRTE